MGEDGTMKCPCKRCRNLNWLSIDDVRFHLLAKGMLEGYTVWTSHGEERGRKRSRTSHNRYCVREPTRVEQPVDLNAMLHDFAGENSEFYNNVDTGTRNVEEVPNDSARKLYEVIVENGAPIYPGNTKYTRLSFTTKLLEFKNISHCSNKAFDSLLTLFADVLPKKHTLPQTYYEMKKIMKGLRVEYQKIDLCENDCMLFYGDDKDKVVCDICGQDRYRDVLRKDGKKIPKKILRHFPLIPRLQRLYMSKHTSDHMRWYKNRDVKDGEISHPADGEEWKNFDRRYPSFAQEIRNIRLGLATDGFNPFGPTGKKTYSVWPIVVVVYNLPPSMCMKKPYMFMTDIVPGPNSIGKDINVCLRPLIDELKILWNTGIETYDQSLKQNFTMRAALMWTISDYPAMSMISGWSGKGKLGCQVCLGSVQGFQLKHCGKCSFYGTNRIFLEPNDPLRRKSNLFDNAERRVFRGRLSGEGVKELLDGLVFPPPGKTNTKARSIGYGEEHHWTHVPIFYELPYWSSHSLRYSIDIMHTEKNVFENLFFTIVNAKKSKDHKKARADCKHFGVLPHLWIDENGKRYSSNISRCCNVEECTFYGFKSHDCHIFLQKLLPLAIRELLPAPIADAITAIANFFQDLCSSTVTKTDLEIMEKSVVKALCLLETIFPQSWFDSMEHLVVHLAEEIRLAGPAYWHWMYPIERLLGKLKQKVGNKARVEGSIAERYMEEEIVNICAFYFASDSIHNKLSRNEVLFDVQKTDKLEVFKYPCDSLGKERSRYLNDDEQLLADEYVLLNSPEVQPYLRRYQDRVMRQRPETTPQQLDHIVKTRFKAWFKKKVEKDEIDGPRFMDLLEGPALKVMTFETCQVNGYKFSTSSASGSGVVVKGTLHENNLDYYEEEDDNNEEEEDDDDEDDDGFDDFQ
ncbi:uncharacterized protein LOC135152874 [Daucus carota subsp. sativus]|uniref:uncharacterized protein LOC135152874 n=1 Tax=Daucus carota subsp. sativus TaxID=79200 RepID=UPI003082EED3